MFWIIIWGIFFFPYFVIFSCSCLSLGLCLGCFLFYFFFFLFRCMSIRVIWFVIPIRFEYNQQYIYRIVWDCGSLIFRCIFNVLHLSSPLMFAIFDIFVNGLFSILILSLALPVSFSFEIFLLIIVAFSFLPSEVLCHCWRAGLEVLNSSCFCLSEKLLISPLNLNESLNGYCILGSRFLSFITLNIPCHSLLACRFYAEISAVIFMGILLYVVCWFSPCGF